MAVVEAAHLWGEPGGDVDAVGDVADGHGVFGLAGIEIGPHGSRDFAVQGGDCVGAAGEFEAEDGHAEGFLRVGGVDAAEGHERVV